MNHKESIVTYTEERKRLRTTKPWIPIRFLVVFLSAFATAFVMCQRINLSVAIVAMVKQYNLTNSSEPPLSMVSSLSLSLVLEFVNFIDCHLFSKDTIAGI